ncbi:MAG: response regulator, partial [Candidatus Omnitrophica bacterium]|nr:response regulator [Candidatus Omnitrophota bacterium]
VLMDVKMPGISGIEILKILKQIREDIYVIMITAFADEIFYKQGLSEGDYEVIQKPVDIDKLLMRLKEFSVKRKDSGK